MNAKKKHKIINRKTENIRKILKKLLNPKRKNRNKIKNKNQNVVNILKKVL